MTFYLKYRSKIIEDLDIDSVRQSLKNILKSNDIPHAFLFSGPKGTGKTSAARIMAKAINCEQSTGNGEPCNKCQSCKSITNGNNIDVIEMDAASNRGIDDIRSLKDSILLSPTQSKAKIYIIDEAHMLTTEASNALLKTLEEPPAHAYFILATTNPEKLIPTIRSRSINILFTKATDEEIKRSLRRVVKGENIKIGDVELEKIVRIANGSFRDAVKNLENYYKDPDFLKVGTFEIDKFMKFIEDKDIDNLIDQIKFLSKNGLNIDEYTNEILAKLEEKIILNKDRSLVLLVELILKSREYNKVSPIEELPLLLAFIKWFNN